MANILKKIILHSLFPKSNNLASFSDPFAVMKQLLAGTEVTNILDAGASHGKISRRFLRMFPDARAHAFEPNPSYRETLEAQNREEPRLVPHYDALSDTQGQVDLHIAKSPGITSIFRPGDSLKKMRPDESEIVSVKSVRTVTIDSWVRDNGDIPVELMKFDIQGGEVKALQGATETLNSSTKLVYTEVMFNELYDNGAIYPQIDGLLRKSGFILYDIYKPRYSSNGTLMWANAIFIHPGRLEPGS